MDRVRTPAIQAVVKFVTTSEGRRGSPVSRALRRAREGRSGVLLIVATVALTVVGCATTDTLRDAKLVVEDDLSIYAMNGTGSGFHEVIARVKTGETPHEALWDAYFQPALAPGGSSVACIRFRNYTRFSGNDPTVLPRQSSEVVILHLDNAGKPATDVVYSMPGQRGVVYQLGAPIWSRDGRGVFFIASNRVIAYWINTTEIETIAELPDVVAGFREEYIASTYLRLSREGDYIFALLSEQSSGMYSVWRIHWATRAAARVWRGRSLRDGSGRLDPELDDATVEALFGSRESPVMAPRNSADGRFYFFVKSRWGLFGRLWVGGYDRQEHREFTVRTLRRGLLWK